MTDPKTLADKPIADRRGDDALDRHVHHVIDHPEPDVVGFDDEPLAPEAERGEFED